MKGEEEETKECEESMKWCEESMKGDY
jgi:hypothetical protein